MFIPFIGACLQLPKSLFLILSAIFYIFGNVMLGNIEVHVRQS